jgi:preprotein translocase subunit YajC
MFQCLNIFGIFFLHIFRKQFQKQNKFNSNKNNLNKLKQSIKLFKKEYKGYKVSLLN